MQLPSECRGQIKCLNVSVCLSVCETAPAYVTKGLCVTVCYYSNGLFVCFRLQADALKVETM